MKKDFLRYFEENPCKNKEYYYCSQYILEKLQRKILSGKLQFSARYLQSHPNHDLGELDSDSALTCTPKAVAWIFTTTEEHRNGV